MEKNDMRIETIPQSLRTFFQAHDKVALAFSGGTDSAYVLYAAGVCNVQVQAYFVKAQFQPEFELEDAREFAKIYGARLTVIPADVLAKPAISANPADRCYHCKQVILSAIAGRAREDGYQVLVDGGNASDDAGDRPGMRAVAQWQVLSPLRLCGITKEQVRSFSKAAGLFTWDKPSYACLATRFPTGMPITAELLVLVEKSENALFAMGFSDFRVRLLNERTAKLQFPANQMETAFAKREEIVQALEFTETVLDLKAR